VRIVTINHLWWHEICGEYGCTVTYSPLPPDTFFMKKQ